MYSDDNNRPPEPQKPVKKTKIQKDKIVILAVSVIFVIFAVIYFNAILPLLNVLYNPMKDDQQGGKPTVDKGDVINKNDPYYSPGNTSSPTEEVPSTATPTPDPAATPEPTVTEEVTPTPDSEDKAFDITKASYVHASSLTFEEGTRNVLLLGFNPEENLCDSIFIVNINEKTKEFRLISIPRDTYVPHSETVIQILKDAKLYRVAGIHKINATVQIGQNIIHYTGGKFGNSGIDFIVDILESLLPGLVIDDYVYVDFYGFMDVIDVVGGVYVTSPENMYTEKGELAIPEGRSKLTARETLFYVRYRKRLDSTGKDTYTGSDDWRKINQTNFLAEVATQIITKENMTLSKVQGTLEVLKKSVYHSITPDKLGTYLSIGMDFADKQYKIINLVVQGVDIDPFGDNAWYVQLD
ncbi:MAG: LCP family protein [Clostridia bacterium]|nr:LCP family protein [Clostridia bacterium]